MRIAFDARPLTENKAGIGRYTDQLIRAIIKLAPDNEYFLFSNRDIHFAAVENCHLIKKGGMMGNIWLQLVLPGLLKTYGIDLLHSPMYLMPLATNLPTVITVHDLVYRVFPETTNWKNRVALQAVLPCSIKKARRIIAVSENTRKDILKYYPNASPKIKVIPLGCDERYTMASDQDFDNPQNSLPGLPKHYILTVGTLEPRKNLVRLFQAYKLLRQNFPELKQKLLVVGARGWQFADILTELQTLGLSEQVILTDYVPDEKMPLIYHRADLFVFPSLYEGFGLPPLEAMVMGVPVVSSAAGSLQEVVGDAALLFDPYDINDMCLKMAEVLSDPQRQEAMRLAGFRHAGKFTWENAARKTLLVYREVTK